MTPADLRALAAYHAERAANARLAAMGMGESPVADRFARDAARHDTWSEQLTELADAFALFRPGDEPQP